ncbi:hypothetical protein CHCC5027_3571 [Bacillus paralicheniformis]|uniref:hypothetical protein n=1 Tax=Bacillus paralicheniformis TaxID=1648923 RepID=UPI00119EEFB4|nr:hypothetical protein [Bacillus paralicheniformis]TWJ39658.1 hypothetical protein CHCC5027_3571 [Bacillus paralicheniformis]
MDHKKILKDAAWLDTLYLRFHNHHIELSIELDNIIRRRDNKTGFDKSRPLEIYKEAQTMMHIFRDAPSATSWNEAYWLYNSLAEKAKDANELVNGEYYA